MKKSYSIFLSTLFCFLFCSLSAQDAQLNAASRKVIIEAPAVGSPVVGYFLWQRFRKYALYKYPSQ